MKLAVRVILSTKIHSLIKKSKVVTEMTLIVKKTHYLTKE